MTVTDEELVRYLSHESSDVRRLAAVLREERSGSRLAPHLDEIVRAVAGRDAVEVSAIVALFPDAEVKQVYNWLGYLVRLGRIRRLSYGLYGGC